MLKLNISESFICKIWAGGKQFCSKLQTTDGDDVEIIDYGIRNFDGGPDYKNAKLRIANKVLVGDIEVHREFKDWEQHRHRRDYKYNSVILQLVMWDSEKKTEPRLRIKRPLPTIVLSHFLNRSIHDIWQEIIENPDRRFKLPCADLNHEVNDSVVQSFLEKLSVERLEMKSSRMKERLKELETERGAMRQGGDDVYTFQNIPDWEQVLYEFVFEALGYSKNKEPMMKLARNLRLEMISRVTAHAFTGEHGENRAIVRAIMYGASGFLFDLKLQNKYANKLKTIWNEYRSEIRIPIMQKAEWQFFRLRPQNFPSVRLVYGCELVLELLRGGFLRRIIPVFAKSELKPEDILKNLIMLFNKLEYVRSETVQDYLSFLDSKVIFRIGKQRITGIIVNVVIPFVYVFAKIFKKELISKKILQFYREVKAPQENSILRIMKSQLMSGRAIKINNPAIEQGLTQLYNFYCMRERCLECKIGEKVFTGSGYEYKIIFY
jgi:hypothetical protein